MKKSFSKTVGLLGVIFILSGCGNSNPKTEINKSAELNNETPEASGPHKYGVKSGIVTYENTGYGLTTKSILYFDDWGAREAEEKYDTDGVITETSICDGKNLYLLIHKNKSAYKRGECTRGVAYKFDWNEVSRSQDYKPTKLENIDVAGKDCESFSLEISGSKTIYAGWNNVSFMIETPAGNSSVLNRAISFEENASIPEEMFAVPPDYNQTEM